MLLALLLKFEGPQCACNVVMDRRGSGMVD